MSDDGEGSADKQKSDIKLADSDLESRRNKGGDEQDRSMGQGGGQVLKDGDLVQLT